MSDPLDSDEATLFALDQPGPAMDPEVVGLVYSAIDTFEEDPGLRTTTSFIQYWEGRWRYNLVGLCLRLLGYDLRVLQEINERYAVSTELTIEAGFSTFDYYALGELFRHAESPQHLRELFEEYAAFPCRIDIELRGGKPADWSEV